MSVICRVSYYSDDESPDSRRRKEDHVARLKSQELN